MNPHSACIITIGNELLNGDVVNTNATWLADFLRSLGIQCKAIVTISDSHSEIKQTLTDHAQKHDVIILSGGLGPTRDDVTKNVLVDYFDDYLVRNQEVLHHVINFFKKRGRAMCDVNFFQADVPSKAKVLFNDLGTAPGLLFEQNGKLIAALPGVPYELKFLAEQRLLSEIERKWDTKERRVNRHWFRLTGIGESDISEKIMPAIDDVLSSDMQLAFLPHPGGVDVCLTQVNGPENTSFSSIIETMRAIAGPFVYTERQNKSIYEVALELLRKKDKKVAFAESCTGGYLANAFTNVPGSSTSVLGGYVAYDNSFKTDILDINKEILYNNGAVSSEVALEMAENTGKLTGADFTLATTGIAGPSGGSLDKPVGTVWVGFWSRNQVHVACRYQLTTERHVNKKRTAYLATDILRRCLLGLPEYPLSAEVVDR